MASLEAAILGVMMKGLAAAVVFAASSVASAADSAADLAITCNLKEELKIFSDKLETQSLEWDLIFVLDEKNKRVYQFYEAMPPSTVCGFEDNENELCFDVVIPGREDTLEDLCYSDARCDAQWTATTISVQSHSADGGDTKDFFLDRVTGRLLYMHRWGHGDGNSNHFSSASYSGSCRTTPMPQLSNPMF